MYRILIDAGIEGHYFVEEDYESAEDALKVAMEFYQNFIIVKIIKFAEKGEE